MPGPVVPSVQPESLQPGITPEPPHAAFMGSAVGAGLSTIGESLFKTGHDAYMQAAEAHAQEAETEFQKKALKLRDEFRLKEKLDAVGAHDQYTQALEAARVEVGKSLRSKHGLSLYNNNSLRNMRFVQESIDQHFEKENHSYQKFAYDQTQALDTKMVADAAADPIYDPEKVEKIIDGIMDRAKERVKGVSPEEKETYAKNEAHKATHALLEIMFRKESGREPDLIKSELDKYSKRGMVDPGVQKDAVRALGGTQVNVWLSRTMANLPRVDTDGESDPEGVIPHKAILEAQSQIDKGDPNRQAKVDALTKAWERSLVEHGKAGDELRQRLERKGMRDGTFAIPENDLDWQKYERLYPTEARKMREQADDRVWKSSRRTAITAREAARVSFGAVRYYIDQLSPDDVKDVTPATVSRLVDENYKGPGLAPPEEKSKAIEFLKKVQTGKLDPVERQFNSIASQVLEEAYKGNKKNTRAAMNVAHYFLDDLHKSEPNLTAEDLRERLQKATVKKGGLFDSGFLGARDIDRYERKIRIPRVSTQEDYDRLPKGTKYIDPNGNHKEKQ